MKNMLLPLLVLCPFLLPAQNNFRIDGKVDALKNGDKIFLVYQLDDQQKSDSAPVQNGRFVFTGKLAYPVYATLYLNKNPLVNKPAPKETVDFFKLLLEPARFTLTAQNSLQDIQIKGSAINDLNKELKARLQPNEDKFKALTREFLALPIEKQKSVRDSFAARERALLKESYRINLTFIKKHPDSYLSLMRLSYVAADPDMNAEAKKAYAQLSPALKKTPMAKGIVAQLAAPEKTKVGKLAPDFEQSTPNGKKVKLSNLRSKYVLLDFWASWCAPCRKENPNVVAAYNMYKNKGFTVLGVSLDQPGKKDAWIKAIEKDQLTWLHVSDLKGWENKVARMYGVRSIPANFLIDPKGKIIARDLRGQELQDKLAQIFAGK